MVALPRTSWRRRPLLVLIILILLLVIGYAARAVDDDSGTGSWPARPHSAGSHRLTTLPGPAPASTLVVQLASTAHRGGRLAAKAAMPSCACGPAK